MKAAFFSGCSLITLSLLAFSIPHSWAGGQDFSRTGKVIEIDRTGRLVYEVHVGRTITTYAAKVGPECSVTIDGISIELRELRRGQAVTVYYKESNVSKVTVALPTLFNFGPNPLLHRQIGQANLPMLHVRSFRQRP